MFIKPHDHLFNNKININQSVLSDGVQQLQHCETQMLKQNYVAAAVALFFHDR